MNRIFVDVLVDQKDNMMFVIMLFCPKFCTSDNLCNFEEDSLILK